MWTVILRTRFVIWLQQQPEELRRNALETIELLKEYGPGLKRPYADTLKGTKLSNLKELRIQHKGKPIRAFFAFDPVRRAIVLCAGDKSGDKRFYDKLVPIAEEEFAKYLSEWNDEKPIYP